MAEGGYKPRIDTGTAFPQRPKPPESESPAEFGSDQWVEDTLRFVYGIAKAPALLRAADSYRKPEA